MNSVTLKAVGIHIVDINNRNRFKLVFTNGAGTEITAIIDSDETLAVFVDIDAIPKLKPVKELLENILEKGGQNND